MIIQFTLQGLMLFLVCTLGIVAGILLLPILWNIKKVIGILRPLVETNQESFKRAIKIMPEIFENVGHISSNVRDTTDKLRISAPVILKEVECVTNSAKGSIESVGVVMENIGTGINDTIAANKKDASSFMTILHIIEEVIQSIYRTFTSGK